MIGNETSLPAVWDSTRFPDGAYHVVLEITGKVLFFKVLAQVISVEFTIDNTPPSLVVKDLDNGEVTKGAKRFSIRAEGGLVRDVIVDGLRRLPIPQDAFVEVSLDTELLGDGRHEMRIIAKDSIGNTEDRIMWFVVDNTPPKILSLGPAEELSVRGDVEIQPAINELTLAGQTWWIDDEIVSRELPLKLNTGELSDGDHTLRLEVTDQSGLTSQYAATFCVDNSSAILELTRSSSIQGVVSRAIHVNGKTFRADHSLEIYKRNPGDNISVQIMDNLGREDTSFLKMRFTVKRSVANMVNQALGERVGQLFAYRILPIIKGFTEMPSFLDIVGFSIGTETSARPPIPPVWDSLAAGSAIYCYRLPMVEMCNVQQGCMRGIGIRISLQRLRSLHLTETEKGLEISAEASSNPIESILEFGTMGGTYDKHLLEETIIGNYVHKTWEESLLEETWMKVGYRLEERPFIGFLERDGVSLFRVGMTVGLKAIQLDNIRMTHRISCNNITYETVSDNVLNWSTDQFFQLAFYWGIDVGIGN